MKDGYILVLFILGIFLVFTVSGTITGNPILSSSNLKNSKEIFNAIHGRCHVTSFDNQQGYIGETNTCNKLCALHNEICISGSFEEFRMEKGKRYTAYTGDLVNCDYQMYPSNFDGIKTYNCMCCSTKANPPYY